MLRRFGEDRKRGGGVVDEGGALRGAAGLPSHLGTWGETVEIQSRGTSRWAQALTGVTSSPPPDGPGPHSDILLLWNGEVEGWAASGPVRRDGGEREGLGGGLSKLATNGREMAWLTLCRLHGWWDRVVEVVELIGRRWLDWRDTGG